MLTEEDKERLVALVMGWRLPSEPEEDLEKYFGDDYDRDENYPGPLHDPEEDDYFLYHPDFNDVWVEPPWSKQYKYSLEWWEKQKKH